MSENDTNPPEEEPKPQFGLRALLVFVFLCGLYFSQFRFFDVFLNGEDVDVTAASTIWLGWFAFGWFYWSRRLYGALVVHCFLYLFVLVGIVIVIVAFFAGTSREFPGFGEMVRGCIFGGAWMSLVANLFSFPAAVLMLLVKAFKVTREWRL